MITGVSGIWLESLEAVELALKILPHRSGSTLRRIKHIVVEVGRKETLQKLEKNNRIIRSCSSNPCPMEL